MISYVVLKTHTELMTDSNHEFKIQVAASHI